MAKQNQKSASPMIATKGAKAKGRIEVIDLARGTALVAMASYHFTFDLEMFGAIARGTATTGGWRIYALCIASSFLILVGIGMVLGHGDNKLSQINWPAWSKRFLMIVACSLIISVATWFQNSSNFVFFGILHEIAFASLVGLLFLPLSWWLCAASAAIVFISANLIETPLLDAPVFWWTGLQAINPRSVDYVPTFPWFGMVLVGIALAKIASQTNFFQWLSGFSLTSAPSRLLKLFGRHSLLFYMLHQPILFGGVYLFFWMNGKIG